MRTDLSDITLVVDRSGSMSSCQPDAQGGINTFIEEQKKLKGEALLSLIQFDTEYEWIHKGKPINEVGRYELQPRGFTALLDAVGKAIIETGERLKAIPENERPGLVIIAIVTDGQENSSKEFSKKQIKEMITQQQDVYKWQFTFLGANQDAFAEAGSMGFNYQTVSNYDPNKVGAAYVSLSANVGRMRNATYCGLKVENKYTDQEIKAMVK